jgi:hypothetical protein
VTTWCDARLPADLYVTSSTAAEIHFGIACMTEGRRRADLQERFNGFLDLGFAGRVLDFTAESAKSYGPLMAARRAAGRPISAPDGRIAAVCRAQGARLATRNVKDFEACGIDVVNPFEA